MIQYRREMSRNTSRPDEKWRWLNGHSTMSPAGSEVSRPSQSSRMCDPYASEPAVTITQTGSRRQDAAAAETAATTSVAPTLCDGPRWRATSRSRSGARASPTTAARSPRGAHAGSPGARQIACATQAAESPASPWPMGLGI